MDVGETVCEGVDCIHLAENSDQSRGLFNTVMNLGVSYKKENFLTS